MAELEGKILGRYELKELIGRGSMAEVYKGYDRLLKREIAVKVFKHTEEQMLLRFIREAEVMSQMSHPHLVTIYDSDSSLIGNIAWYYYIMPLMKGSTLRTRIQRSPLSLMEASTILSDIAGTLDYIHSEGIIHRDIKASNVLFDAKGHCYLSDFGIAHINNPDLTQLTGTSDYLGTYNYMAPELIDNAHEVKPGSDLYSLGVLLFEMVTGKLPFSSSNPIVLLKLHLDAPPPTPSSIVPEIPGSVNHVVLRALAKKPDERYSNAAELAVAFRDAVANSEQMTLSNNVTTSPPVQVGGRMQVPPVPSGNSTGYSGMQPAPIPPSRGKRRNFAIALIALVALLLITIPVVGLTVRNKMLFSNDAIATATARVRIQQARAATITAATATVKAHAIATVGVLATATGGTLTYFDALNDSTNPTTTAEQWDGADGSNSQCSFNTDGYHVKASTSFLNACEESGYQYGNATISVNVIILSGGSGGLFLRFSGGACNGYLFEIDSTGRFKFSYFGEDPPMQDWTFSPALNRGYQVTNTIAVIMQENTFALYANGQYLTTVTDSSNTITSSATDYLAFFASAPDTSTEVVFSNLEVY